VGRPLAEQHEHRLVSTRAVIVLVLVASALSAFVSFSIAAGALHEGPAGPQGASGPPGQPGPPGDAAISPDDVLSAIERDPEAVAQALSGHLDYDDIQRKLDPDPSDVQTAVEELTSKLDDLCSDLASSDAVGGDITSC
jgi:hypothetical protein